MDEFQKFFARYDAAKDENGNAFLSGDRERIAVARRNYFNLQEEFHYMFQIHRERVEHGKGQAQD